MNAQIFMILVFGALLSFALIFFYIRAFVWIMTKGSPVSQLIVGFTGIVFCLIMAKCNNDQSTFYTIAFGLTSLFYFWVGWQAFNKLVPTKEEDGV